MITSLMMTVEYRFFWGVGVRACDKGEGDAKQHPAAKAGLRGGAFFAGVNSSSPC